MDVLAIRYGDFIKHTNKLLIDFYTSQYIITGNEIS